MMHQIANILEDCQYVRCIMIDFSRAFDVVNHALLLSKLSSLGLPDCIVNWVVSFLSELEQMTSVAGNMSQLHSINQGIVQGSGVGPMLYAVMDSDLRTLSRRNFLFKYADDTNLLVPANSDMDVATEFEHIKHWAMNNKMVINMSETKELVFRRPSINYFVSPAAVPGIAQVDSAKLLGIIFDQKLNFHEQVEATVKVCSQRGYLMKLLRDQGLPDKHMDCVFNSLVLCKLRYAIFAWGGHVNLTQKAQINRYLKRMYRYHYTTVCYEFEDLLYSADHKLFTSMCKTQHCLHSLLPPIKDTGHHLRQTGHPYELPYCYYSLTRATFVLRSVYNFR